MADTTTRDLNRMLSGETPLTTPEGEVLSPAKTTVGPTPNNPLDAATIVRGRNGEILMGGALIRNPNPNKDINSARIGDYVYDNQGQPQTVPNSYRDIVSQYVIRRGEQGVEHLNLYDYMSALSKGIAGALGVPTDSSNIGTLLGTAAIGQAAKAIPGGQLLWAGANVLKSIGDSAQAYADKYFNQEIDYDLGVEFTTDENGNTIASPRYDKMSDAGHGSGGKIVSLTDTEKSGASLDENNQLNVRVSRAFANSDAYQAIKEDLLDNLTELTKEQANEVVDEDTGRTRIETISDYIKQAETRYYYNAKSIQRFKEIAPAASEESLAEATYTQLAGYVSSDNLAKMTITVYNSENIKEEVNAKAWLDDIAKKSKTARNDYMNSVASRIQSEDISDDEKVVLQAQANVLYAASENGDYAGMYKKDFFDSLGDASVPIFSQISWNDIGKSFGGYGTLDAFERNDFYAGALQVGQTFANAKALSALMNATEAGLRGATMAAGDGVLSGTGLGKALSNINQYAPQDVPVRLPSSVASASGPSIVASGAKEYLGKTAVQTGAQAAADLVVDAIKGATYKQLGYEDRFNFLEEFGSDVLFDALMSYGPRNYVERAERTAYKVLDSEERLELEDIDGNKTGEVLSVPGVKIVEKTADDVAKIHAERIDKLTDSNLAIKTQELFTDKNAAMAKMAVQIRRVVNGDNYLYRLMLRAGSDIRQLTNDVRTAFNQVYKTDLNAFTKTLSEVAPKFRDWSQADRDYFNAAVQHYRFSQENKGDKEALKEVDAFYKKALNGVDKDRKAQLDKLITAGRALAGDVLDFYKQAGILSESAVAELRSKPAYTGGMYFPVWQKAKRLRGGEIAQTRAAIKSIWNKAELIKVEDMEDPLVTLTQYIGNAARNVAVNERAKVIRTVGSVPGMKLHVIADTGGALSEVENLKELETRFAKIYDGIVKKVNKEYPTREEWQKQNSGFVMRSKAFQIAKELEALQREGVELRKGLRRARYAAEKDPSEEKVNELFDADTLVGANKQAQLYAIDRIKEYTRILLNRAASVSKSETKLDIETYLDVQVTNMLKSALRDNDSTGKVQIILNDAVEKANPYVDRADVIQREAEVAARNFRRSVNRTIKIKGNKNKTPLDKINELVDKTTDEIEARVMGEKATVKVIDDAEATRILNSSGDSHTIRYLLDGVEQRMVLTGKGSEQLVKEFYAPEGWIAKNFSGRLLQKAINAAGWVSNTKRVMTSSFDIGRVMPNLARDWSRGVVTTGGQLLLSPDMIRDWAVSMSDGSKASLELIDNGFELVKEGIDRSTFTSSMEVPKKNRAKSMVRAANEPDGNAFVRFVYDRIETPTKMLSTLQDMAETYTRSRAMEVSYYRELANAYSKGYSTEEAVKRATEAAYFYGREATTNFYRRGRIIATLARNVPYLSQNFATLESFKYTFLDNPITTTRVLQDTTLAYTAMVALALSNEESRKKYYLLSEYDRANNIIIPLTNDSIITIPLDETMATFLTPYRRTVESLAGVDPESFFVIFGETLEALSPFDLSGFSEGDKFNIVRGLEKLGSQVIPTWAQPIVEALTGRDLYYGSTLAVTQEDIGEQTGVWNSTPGQLTTKGKNSKTLAEVSENTGIPQWILQNTLSEYFGSTGQYALNVIDKLAGATGEAQGGKEWSDSIFKPFTGSDSNEVNQTFWNGVSTLKEEKKNLQKELKTIKTQMDSATGNTKAELENKRREKINAYGTKVSDFLNQYLSAYEITGGLSKSQANQVWYLYKLYDDSGNADMYDAMTTGEYYSNKLATYNNRRATALASASGIDQYIDPNVAKADTLAKNVFDPNANFYETYAQSAFMNSVYGDATQNVYRIETALKSSNLLGNKMWAGYDDAKAAGKSALKKYKSDWNTQVLLSIAPTVEEVGIDAIIGSSTVLDYLDNYLFDVTTFNRKEYIKKAFGG